MDTLETLTVASPEEFRDWLERNHQIKKEIWLVFFKQSSGRSSLSFDLAVETALCFGWIDGKLRSLDADRYARRFTPRRPGSHWTETNRALARRLLAEGRMTAAGRAALPADWKEALP